MVLDISIIQGATASISYIGSLIVQDKDKAKVTMSGQSKGTYSASAAGLSIDSKSGETLILQRAFLVVYR
jgi:hypothetical protein